VVYEAFVEWKAWMDGETGTIFDGFLAVLMNLKSDTQIL
jgi:hypothetical protein